MSAYKKIGELPSNGKYILKIKNPDEAKLYPQFDRYSCRRIGNNYSPFIISEIQANDIREIQSLRQYNLVNNIRIVGLDDLISHDYTTAFNSIKNTLNGRIELCPEDDYYCATAIAVEWVMQGGSFVAASFAGIGGKAALEEVLMALRLEKRHKPNISFSVFPQLKELFEEITKTKIEKNKPIIGNDIFNVEAGIHANGIAKDPKIYEPFNPELVGNERKLILGKHSGKSAISIKLQELGLTDYKGDIQLLLLAVQNKSIEKQSSLTDDEFKSIYNSFISKQMDITQII